MSVTHVWVGATTHTSAWVRGKVSGVSTRLAVSTSAALTNPTYFGPVVPTADGIASLLATGLAPNTRYYFALEDGGVLDTAFSGTFRTHPVVAGERASFVFGAAGDAGLAGAGDASHITSAVSNNPVFDTMRAQAAAEEWLFFSHLGDLHYRNIATATTADYRAGYNDTLTFNGTLGATARQGQFFRNVAMTYAWDDHDFGPNNSDRTAAGNATANTVYRERVPHYTLPSASAIYQSWQVGRVLFIASDVRSARDPNTNAQAPTKTMLGTAQKTWMEQVLASTSAEALVWISPSRWLADSTFPDDTWNSFLHERNEIIDLFGDTGWLDKMVQLTADMHNLSLCSGPANPWGGFPIYMFASMDASYGSVDSLYDLGSVPGRQQYGTMAVRDRGHTIELEGTAWMNGTRWRSHTAYVHIGTPILALDYAGGHIKNPFRPTVDTEGAVNDFAARRQDGGEVRYVQTDGPRGTAAIGPKQDSATVQVASDIQLGDQAAWRVHLGTSADARIPEVNVDLARVGNTGALAEAVAGAVLGDKVTIAHPPSDLPPDTVQLIAEGYGETIGEHEWAVQFNTTPGRPWNVSEIPQSVVLAGPDQPNRWDTSGSQLVNAVSSAASQFVVHTPPDGVRDRAPWIQSSGITALLPTHFPFDLELGGEVVRCTACTPSALDQFGRSASSGWGSATIGGAWSTSGGSASDYDVNGTVGRHSHGTRNTFRYTSLNSLSLTDVEVRASITLPVVPTGDTMSAFVLARANIGVGSYYFARLMISTASTMQLSLRKRLPAETVLATAPHVLPFTAGATYKVRLQIQGTTVRAKAWPSAGIEPEDWEVSATDTSLASGVVGCGSFIPTTNTNVLPVVFSFDEFEVFPQLMTVQRASNGVSKGHAAGTSLSLAQPAPLGL